MFEFLTLGRRKTIHSFNAASPPEIIHGQFIVEFSLCPRDPGRIIRMTDSQLGDLVDEWTLLDCFYPFDFESVPMPWDCKYSCSPKNGLERGWTRLLRLQLNCETFKALVKIMKAEEKLEEDDKQKLATTGKACKREIDARMKMLKEEVNNMKERVKEDQDIKLAEEKTNIKAQFKQWVMYGGMREMVSNRFGNESDDDELVSPKTMRL